MQDNVKVRGTTGLTLPAKQDGNDIHSITLRGRGQTYSPPDFDVVLAQFGRALQVRIGILYDIPMADVMERINLNVPADVRRQLRELASRAGRTEAEMARTLLIGAIERMRREEFYRRVADAYTPELRERELKILHALEKLGG